MNVTVREGQYEHASRILRKKMQRAGIFQHLQKKKHHIPPTQIRTEKKNNKIKTINRFLKNRMKKEGY